jgi:hypothetical protein
MKTILRLRLFTVILLVLALLAVSYKYYLGIQKVSAYEDASRAYQSKQYIKAEEYYQEALHNWSFDYNENDISKKYEILLFSKNKLVTLMEQGNKEFRKKDYGKLLENYQKLETLKVKNEDNTIFQDYYSHLKIEEQYLELFEKAKSKIIKKMETSTKNKVYSNNEDFFFLAKFPSQTYGDNNKKIKELTNLYKTYDLEKYEYLQTKLSYEDVKGKIQDQITIYKNLGINQNWLSPLLNDLEIKNNQAVAKMKEEQEKREAEYKKAQEEQQAQDPIVQEEVMNAVNAYANSWIQAYNSLDSSYFVNITPKLQQFFDQRFIQITNNNATFTGELKKLEFDLDSFNYENNEGTETITVIVEITMNSASYNIGDEYELEISSNPWLYTLIKDSNGQWLLDERKEISNFNYNNTRVFDMGYSY